MTGRINSLDAFRGFTIAAMLLVNNPGDWGHLYGPLAHAKWHGWTFTDWIFPFFVFISGISMTISLGRRAALGDSKTALLAQTLRRGATIIAIGLLLNLIPTFNFAEVRIPGVLQRLGLCTMLAAPLVLWLNWRQQLGALLALLVVYSFLLLAVPVPDVNGNILIGSLNPGEDTGAWLDRLLMDGHLWKQAKIWDPEGLLSTMPAVASQLAGVLAGHWLASRREPAAKAMGLMVGGLACLWIGQVLDAWLMPINKSLWTPPYVFAMAGWACLVFGTCYWLLDAQPSAAMRERVARWARPLLVFGMNALFLFAISGLIAKLMGYFKPGGLSLKAWAYQPIQSLGLAPVNASLLYALCFVAVLYGIAHFMWSKKWFVKV